MEVVKIINHHTGRVFEKGFFSQETVEHCKREPDVFEIVYSATPVQEKTKYSKESLSALSMKDLRDLYEFLCAEKQNPPGPTNSKDGIINVILELQED